MTLIDSMIALNARLTSIPIRFGVPQYKPVLVRHAVLDSSLSEQITDTLLEPLPYVENVKPSLVNSPFGESIGLRNDDFKMTGVPRTYTLDFLQENVLFYAISPDLTDAGEVVYNDANEPRNAVLCKAIHVSDRDLLTWSLILRQLRDRRDSERVLVRY